MYCNNCCRKWFRFYVFFFQFLIFYKLYGIGKALRGLNVKDAKAGDFPFAVYLRNLPPGTEPGTEPQHLCTGSLVTMKDVITAAHCVEDVTLQQVNINIGNIDMRLSTPFTPFWWMHYNEWANQMQVPLQYPTNDIAWIKLHHYVAPELHVLFGNYSNEALAAKKVKVAGWGYQEDGSLRYILQKGKLYVMPKDDCDHALSQLSGMKIVSDARIMCTYSDPPVIFENGDNGGPLIHHGQLAAINIGTCPGNVGFRRVNMHTSLKFYNNFISSMLHHF